MMKRALFPVFLLTLFCGLVSVARAAEYVEGKHYQRLDKPVMTQDKDRIEVAEFFWYGCIHCYHFEPLLSAWSSRQADDVYLLGSPVNWSDAHEVHAKAYYTAETLGVLDQVHEPLFAALNASPKAKLDNEDELAKFFAGYGVPEADFRKTFNSFGVSSQVRQGEARARSTKIEGTPELLVNGKYRVSASLAGGQKQMLEVVDFLIVQERDGAQ